MDVGNADLWAIKSQGYALSIMGNHLKILQNCMENCLMGFEGKPGICQDVIAVTQARGGRWL